MEREINLDISVSVESTYEYTEYLSTFVRTYFSYKVKIQNNGLHPVKLISRVWFIWDSSGNHKEVEGEGVIGLKPVIGVNESFIYKSGTTFTSDMGYMKGYYIMQNQVNGKILSANIPPFFMIDPARLN